MTDGTIYNISGAVVPLKEGHTVLVRDFGDSMVPMIFSGQTVRVAPYRSEPLRKGDVVLAKVGGHLYLHKITALRAQEVQIGNNRGKVNGWTSRAQIYGRVLK